MSYGARPPAITFRLAESWDSYRCSVLFRHLADVAGSLVLRRTFEHCFIGAGQPLETFALPKHQRAGVCLCFRGYRSPAFRLWVSGESNFNNSEFNEHGFNFYAPHLDSIFSRGFLCSAWSGVGEVQYATAAESARHTNQGVLFARNKQYEKPIGEFTKAIQEDPNDPKNYENRALVYRLSNKPDQALSDLSKLIELRPKDADAYASKGQIEVEQAKLDPAIKDLTRAIELDPKNENAWRYRAYAFLQKQQWNKAIEDYSKVIERSPNDVGAHERRGYAYRNLGKYNEAIADFSKVIEARPKDPEAYRERGLTYRLMQEYAKAADDFRTLLQLKPNDTDAQSRLNYVDAKLYAVHPQPFTPIPHRVADEAARKARAAMAAGQQAQLQRSPTPTPSPVE